MTKSDIIKNYNYQIGSIVPNIQSNNGIDICSLQDVIDNSSAFSFKVDLFPTEIYESLSDFTDTSFYTQLDNAESMLINRMKQIAFYPKYNTTFEKKMHVPIISLDSINCSDILKTVFQIPIKVIYYIMFGNTLNSLTRYYNSNLYFDHTGYALIPSCILSNYNFNDLFSWAVDSTTPYSDSSIQNNGIDFTYANNFSFIIDDMDIYAERKNIVFMEVVLNSSIENFNFYVLIKNGSDVFLKKGNVSKLNYRKIFYNADFINIKNRIIKYSD